MQLTDTAHSCSIMCTFVFGDKLTRFSRCCSLSLPRPVRKLTWHLVNLLFGTKQGESECTPHER